MTALRKLTLRVGRRGLFLVLFGAVYLLIGYSYLTVSQTSQPLVKHALRLALNVAPLTVYGWLWVAAGGLAAVSGLFTITSSRRPIGFIAAVVMPSLWTLVYLAAWIDGDVPRGWVSALLFGLLAAAVWVVAGMPDPHEFPKAKP